MALLTLRELRDRIAAESRARHWRSPSAAKLTERLKDLREAGQAPNAVKSYAKGRRGAAWGYPEETVAAYIRTEDALRSGGKKVLKRVRSWKYQQRQERAQTLLDWVPNGMAVPRGAVVQALDAARVFLHDHPATSALYQYLERPVADDDETRIEGAHEAIGTALEYSDSNGDRLTGLGYQLASALLLILIFRAPSGDADDISLSEYIEPLREQAGWFRTLFSMPLICESVRVLPINELLTHPQKLVDGFSDDELTAAAKAFFRLFEVAERVAQRKTGVRPLDEGMSWIAKQLRLNYSWIISATAVIGASFQRRDAQALDNLWKAAASIEAFAEFAQHVKRL